MRRYLTPVGIVFLVLAAVVLLVLAGGRPGDETPPDGDASGGAVRLVSARPEAFLVLEAEDAVEIELPVRLATRVEGASGGKCCYLGPEKVNERKETAQYERGYPGAPHPGYARLRLRAPATANYTAWVRVRWSDDCGDSLDIALDGEFLGTVQGNAAKGAPAWRWVRLGGGRFTLSRHMEAGSEHTISLCNREDDLHFDQILLIDAASDYEPSGILEP